MIALLAALLVAANPVTTPPPAATMQALFDSASAAVDSGRCADAVRDFTAVEVRPGRRNPTVTAVIGLRKGRCLITLGQTDEGEAMLGAGLAGVGDAPAYVNDRVLALIARGRLAFGRFDYPAATRDFAAARALAAPADRFEALVWLVRSTMFDANTDARGYADEALALVTDARLKPAAVADVRTLHARVLLNHGDIRGGYAELKKALDEEGGLTLKVNAAMIGTRSDLGIAALLNHTPDDARQYLAYTGAGHGTPFGSAAVMTPPPCDGEVLTPGDSAIVEFGIGDDGAVTSAVPIYASRLGPSAVAFAQAVADWSWRPETLKNIAPLFRAVTRVELRCSTASERPQVLDALKPDLGRWLTSRGIAPFSVTGSDAASVAGARAELARRRAAPGDGLTALPVLVMLGRNRAVPDADRRAALDEAHAIAGRAGAPVAVTTLLAVAAGTDDRQGHGGVLAYRTRLRGLLATPDVAADARSRSVVRLLIAEAYFRSPPPPDAIALLRAVADDAALPEHDSLRSNARVRLASLLAQAGDLPAARSAFAASGVDAQQCALVDAKPVPTHAGVSADAFPREAMRWGFEGWVRLEFDIGADGKLANNRAIIAYPPFIFGPAAVDASRGWRYQQTFRPDGVAGCGGAQQQIKFKIG